MFTQLFKLNVKALAKDKVLVALTLTLAVLVVMSLKKERYAADSYAADSYGTVSYGTGRYAPDPSLGMERWGCPPGQVEYQDGCYDTGSKTYTQGKHRVASMMS